MTFRMTPSSILFIFRKSLLGQPKYPLSSRGMNLKIKNSRLLRLADFFRHLVYQKILGRFPLLQLSALTISRAGFSVYYHTVKRRLKHYSWRFNDVPSVSETSPSETAPLKTMEARTYVRLSDFQMKADREVIRKKLRAINEEIEKKQGV